MKINYNVTGAKRKELVQLIAHFTGCDSKYKGAPTFAYEVDFCTIDKNGSVIIDESADSEVVERLLQMLHTNSFVGEFEDEPQTEPQSEPQITSSEITGTRLAITMPRSEFSDTALANLKSIANAKANLFKKAFDTDELPIIEEDGKVSLAWFSGEKPEEIIAYDAFACKLAEMARTQKRVTATEKTYDNEKYAFRCFLLRLGFIGKEYKEHRKVLLRNLEGNTAFKSGTPKAESEVTENA